MATPDGTQGFADNEVLSMSTGNTTSVTQQPPQIELVIVPAQMVALLLEAVMAVPNCPLPYKTVAAIEQDFLRTQRHQNLENLYIAVGEHITPSTNEQEG